MTFTVAVNTYTHIIRNMCLCLLQPHKIKKISINDQYY